MRLENVSFIMVVRNEAHRIAAALAPVAARVGEVIIVDQQSADDTVAKALPYATVIARDCAHGYCEPSLARAVRHADREWILRLEADEEFAPYFWGKLPEYVADPTTAGYWLNRINYIEGEAQASPRKFDLQLRLFRQAAVIKFPALCHEHLSLGGGVVYDHRPCILHNKTRAEYDAAQARYARISAGGKGYVGP